MTPARLAHMKRTAQMALLDWRLAEQEGDDPPALLAANWELVQEVERLTALIARIEQCLPATDAGLQCPTCGSREHLDEADICIRCDMAAVDVVRRRMTVEEFIARSALPLVRLASEADRG